MAQWQRSNALESLLLVVILVWVFCLIAIVAAGSGAVVLSDIAMGGVVLSFGGAAVLSVATAGYSSSNYSTAVGGPPQDNPSKAPGVAIDHLAMDLPTHSIGDSRLTGSLVGGIVGMTVGVGLAWKLCRHQRR